MVDPQARPAPTVSPDGFKYWDGDQWCQLPARVCEWDGFRWRPRPDGVESRWNGHEWVVRPLVAQAEWNGTEFVAAPAGVESRWNGHEWAVKPAGRQHWDGDRWRPGGSLAQKMTVAAVVMIVLLIVGGALSAYQNAQQKSAAADAAAAQQEAVRQKAAVAEQRAAEAARKAAAAQQAQRTQLVAKANAGGWTESMVRGTADRLAAAKNEVASTCQSQYYATKSPYDSSLQAPADARGCEGPALRVLLGSSAAYGDPLDMGDGTTVTEEWWFGQFQVSDPFGAYVFCVEVSDEVTTGACTR